jgi:protein-disulfide isomerase
MKPFYYGLGVVALAGAAWIGFGVVKKNEAATAPPATMTQVASSQELVQKAKGVIRGTNTAPVKIMVFSDYQCPWCAIYATTVENQVRTNFVDTGKVVEVYHDFPLGGEHKYSFLVARAARCAEDQGKFWEYHDLVFTKQRDWSFQADVPVRLLKGYAKDIGLDRTKFDGCLDSDTHADLVEYNRQLGDQAGVTSTPTVFINGTRAEHPEDWDKLKADIEAALGAGH